SPEAVTLADGLKDIAGEASTDATARSLAVLADLGRLAASVAGTAVDPEALLGSATRTIREGMAFRHASVWRAIDDRLDPVGVSGAAASRLRSAPSGEGLLGEALSQPATVVFSAADE